MKKRILVVSNNCFSLENSNGRTLANLLNGWPSDKLAQFYTHNEIPNYEGCNNYFRVTDKQALLSLFQGGVSGKVEKANSIKPSVVKPKSYSKYRNPLVLILRNIIWNLGFWKGRCFQDWIDEFNPELILVQAGDTAYRLKLATDIAKKRNIPLLVYNSEGYYFKELNYFTSARASRYFYPLFISLFRKQLEKTTAYASHTIYCCEPLKNDFDVEFGKPSTVIYTASIIMPTPLISVDNKQLKISYLGNLSLGRHESLIEVANTIYEIDPEIVVDIYGRCPSEEVYEAFNNCKAINYIGFISYQEVQSVISQSDILLHVENFSEFYVEDIKYGFSTKISDSLMSGRCFFLYAPESLACSQYMLKGNPSGIATSKEELKIKMKALLLSEKKRNSCADKGLELANLNHSVEVVSKQFSDVVASIFEK